MLLQLPNHFCSERRTFTSPRSQALGTWMCFGKGHYPASLRTHPLFHISPELRALAQRHCSFPTHPHICHPSSWETYPHLNAPSFRCFKVQWAHCVLVILMSTSTHRSLYSHCDYGYTGHRCLAFTGKEAKAQDGSRSNPC